MPLSPRTLLRWLGPRRDRTSTPASAAPAPAPASVARPVRRPVGVTGRAAILAVVVCAVGLTLLYPLREYLAQRSEIGKLRRERVAMAHRVSALDTQYQRWQDPAYIRREARIRLHFALPGETEYIVIHATPSPSPTSGPTPSGSPTP